MKRIGIIGGLGPESTTEYYKGIIDRFRLPEGPQEYPEILIHSLNMYRFLGMVEYRQWKDIVSLLLSSVESLHRAGAEFAAIASNTPHIMFDEVRSKSPVPMISIVEATRDRARDMGLKKAGLMGTKFTMQSDFYQEVFAQKEIDIVVPFLNEQEEIHARLMDEIELRIIKDTTRERLLDIVRRMIIDDSIDSLVLGCTELPLILDDDQYGIPFLNTTGIHVDSIVQYCREV